MRFRSYDRNSDLSRSYAITSLCLLLLIRFRIIPRPLSRATRYSIEPEPLHIGGQHSTRPAPSGFAVLNALASFSVSSAVVRRICRSVQGCSQTLWCESSCVNNPVFFLLAYCSDTIRTSKYDRARTTSVMASLRKR